MSYPIVLVIQNEGLHAAYMLYTQRFSQCCGSSEQHEESPKHRHHVEDDIAQERTGGHSERLHQRHAPGNHRGDKYASSCVYGGEGGQRAFRQRAKPGVPLKSFSCLRGCESAPTKQGSHRQPGGVRVGERRYGTEDVRSSIAESQKRHSLDTNSSQGKCTNITEGEVATLRET